jgi:hypothetical protein
LDAKTEKSSIPSDKTELLKAVKNTTLCKLIRFSWWESSVAMEKCGITQEDVFSLTAGPVLMYFESGLVLGAASDPAQNSVIVWLEKDNTGFVTDEPTETDAELFPISALDTHYSNPHWNKVVGQRINNIHIIKRDPQNALFAELQNEVGLEIVMDNGEKFILSHGLHDNSDDFSVIPKSYIDSSILDNLKSINAI